MTFYTNICTFCLHFVTGHEPPCFKFQISRTEYQGGGSLLCARSVFKILLEAISTRGTRQHRHYRLIITSSQSQCVLWFIYFRLFHQLGMSIICVYLILIHKICNHPLFPFFFLTKLKNSQKNVEGILMASNGRFL